jgi:tRNA threonylcarbamoyladenosine biosynthesis protein TsaB
MNRNQLGEGRVIKTAINAQRGQLFAASFRVATQSEAEKELLDCVPVASAEIVDPKLWVNGLGDADFVTGPGLKMATGLIDDAVAKMPSLQVEQEAFRECDVATVAAIGEQKFLAGETVDAWSLKPVYFRPSAAEEVHSAKSR